MSTKTVKALISEEREESPEIGLVDGPHVILTCTSCNAPLADIWVTQPNLTDPITREVFSTEFMAHCCYCGDHSFIEEVHGGFFPGGYGIPHETYPEASYQQTAIDRIEEDDKGVLHVYTVRA
jgi:hypothetical protein